jgi:glycyl-tRNA synthetase beta chain
MRGNGERHDVLRAVFSAQDDDVVRLMERTAAIARFLETDDGRDLLALYRRAANILRIENTKDGPHDGPVATELLREPAERDLAAALARSRDELVRRVRDEEDENAMELLAGLRGPTDAFMTAVRVNDSDPLVRANRLRVLSDLVSGINLVADFSKIEG